MSESENELYLIMNCCGLGSLPLPLLPLPLPPLPLPRPHTPWCRRMLRTLVRTATGCAGASEQRQFAPVSALMTVCGRLSEGCQLCSLQTTNRSPLAIATPDGSLSSSAGRKCATAVVRFSPAFKFGCRYIGDNKHFVDDTFGTAAPYFGLPTNYARGHSSLFRLWLRLGAEAVHGVQLRLGRTSSAAHPRHGRALRR